MIVIDTSALVAILRGEPEARAFAQAIFDAETALIAAPTRLEAFIVSFRSKDLSEADDMERLIERLGILTVGFDETLLAAARNCYTTYGRGNGAGGTLNFGDCFAYALASSRRAPLLFKGDDFRTTDVTAVL